MRPSIFKRVQIIGGEKYIGQKKGDEIGRKLSQK